VNGDHGSLVARWLQHERNQAARWQLRRDAFWLTSGNYNISFARAR
jgi:hypothetical protein